jgi:hypothetical protein
VHDPASVLPPEMWERPLSMTPIGCRACADNPVGGKHSAMLQVSTLSGDQATVGVLVCRVCDHVRAPA